MNRVRLSSPPHTSRSGITRFNRVDPLGLLNWLAATGYLCLFYGAGRLAMIFRDWLIRP